MKYLSWDEMEIKALIKSVNKCKENNEPISKAFYNHADEFLRANSSVRDFYYKLIKSNQNKNLGLNDTKEKLVSALNNARKVNTKQTAKTPTYSKNNLEGLLDKIFSIKIKESAEKLKGANKEDYAYNLEKYKTGQYSNILTVNKNMVLSSKQNKKEIVKKIENPSKLLKMPQKPTLSQNDLNSLFIGLFNLVRKNIEGECKNEMELMQSELTSKNMKILELLKINVALKNQLNGEKVMADAAKKKIENSGLNKLKNKLEENKLLNTKIK